MQQEELDIAGNDWGKQREKKWGIKKRRNIIERYLANRKRPLTETERNKERVR